MKFMNIKKLLLLFIIVSLSVTSFRYSVFAQGSPYQHLMVKKEIQKKGGSLEPLRKPKYKILVAKYAVSEQVNGFVESRVKITLHKILHKEKATGFYDGITVFLYRSPQNAETGSTMAMAKAEWWPKGHSFSPDNTTNITNKSTYIEKYNVFSLPKKIKSTVNGLSVTKRKEIYKEIEVAEAASCKKAKTQHPKYSKNYFEKIDDLDAKAKLQILKKHNISSDTYFNIICEGVDQHW